LIEKCFFEKCSKQRVDHRLVDDDGPYYWHIKSGTIQREPPENTDSSSQPAMNFQRQVVREAEVGSLHHNRNA
jgi:hypothetical protein